MPKKPPDTRPRAVVGRCPDCGANTIRGLDQYGRLAEVDARLELDAAHELAAHLFGRVTYRATVHRSGGIGLDCRTADDILLNPAGYRRDARILREHRCDEDGDQ